jgi:hypothetical protein
LKGAEPIAAGPSEFKDAMCNLIQGCADGRAEMGTFWDDRGRTGAFLSRHIASAVNGSTVDSAAAKHVPR